MSWWLSAPQPPPFYPHLGPTQIHICLGLFQAPPSVTKLQAKPSSSPAHCEHQTQHPMLASQTQPPASNCQHHMLFSSQHMPLSLWSGCGRLGFGSFIPATGDAGGEPRVGHPGLLCPGRCWRVHKTLRGSTCQEAVGLAGGDVLGTSHVLLPAVGSGLVVSLMERPAWQTPAGRRWISRDISSRWPCDIEDSPQDALSWDDSSLPAGPGWLCGVQSLGAA